MTDELADNREKIRTVLQTIVVSLVSQPELAKVSATQAEQTTVFEVSVQKDDRGKVIGRDGTMAKCLRHIISSLSAKHGFRAILDICD